MKNIESIYNTYLRVSRSKKGQPFKLRKDFSNIHNEEFYPTLLRLENFFNRNSYVNVSDFFEAPYEVYEDEKHFDLKFYLGAKAVKVYTLFQQKKLISDPDSELNINAATEGLKFIYNFCKENGLKISEYLDHTTNNMNTVFVHLKEKNLSIYNCLAFPNFQQIVNNNNFELLEFMLGDIIAKLPIFRTKFYASKQCKKICTNGLEILKEKLANPKK